MDEIKTFRDLRCYQLARAAALQVYRTVEDWPSFERFNLIDQALRASRSVGANIGEAWPKRRYEKMFIAKLSDAETEANEMRVWLDTALDCGYITQSVHEDLDETYRRLGASIGKMISQPALWCRSNIVRESQAIYEP